MSNNPWGKAEEPPICLPDESRPMTGDEFRAKFFVYMMELQRECKYEAGDFIPTVASTALTFSAHVSKRKLKFTKDMFLNCCQVAADEEWSDE